MKRININGTLNRLEREGIGLKKFMSLINIKVSKIEKNKL